MNNADIVLLTTKLARQRTRAKLVARPRLMSLLDCQTFTPKLSVVFGPAGYGKSTLLTQYIESQTSISSAWYSLDDGDNNLDVFTQYFLAAYEQVTKSKSTIAQPRSNTKSPSANPKARFTELFNDIVAADKAVRFVLDDFHLITSDRVIDFVEWILKSMPSQMSLLMTSRERPRLQCLSELAVQGNLVEISAKQLMLSLEETEQFLTLGKAVDLDKQSLVDLYDRTEGWVAATQLVLHTLQHQTNPAEFIASFSGTDKDLVAYLGTKVLSQLSEDVQQFILYTSVLKRFNASLCEYVTGNPNANELLEKIGNDGLFLFELDPAREWFRYHHLFGEFVLSRLKAREPEHVESTALKAAKWYLDQGDVYEAIDYYLLAGDFDVALKLVAMHVVQLVQYQGNHEILLRWVEKFPSAHLRSEPTISICFAWSLIFTRNLDQVDTVLAQIEQDHLLAKASSSASPYNRLIEMNLGMLWAMYDAMSGRAHEAQQKTSAWLSDRPDAPSFERGVVLGVHGASCIQSLEFKVARKVLRQAVQEFSLCDAEYGVSWMSFMYGLVLIKQGQIKESKHMLERSLNAANASMGEYSLASALLRLGLGHACYVINELTLAREHIDKGFFSIEEHGHVETVHIAFLTKSQLLLREGKQAESVALLSDAEDFGQRLNLSHYGTVIVLERIRRLLAEGCLDEANSLCLEYGYYDTENSENLYTAYEQLMVDELALRFLFANKEYEGVILRSAELIRRCEKSGLALERIRLVILQLSAYFESGHTNKSFRTLSKLIELVAPEKVLSTFLEERAYLTRLWPDFFKRFHKNSQQNFPQSCQSQTLSTVSLFVEQLRDALNLGESSQAQNDQPDAKAQLAKQLVASEGLSKKEREIMSYLDQGLSNKALASALFVSVSTIKWHLTHIYSKLGVKNRVEAIKAFQRQK